MSYKNKFEYLLLRSVEGCFPLREHMDFCLQVLDDWSVKTVNCLSERVHGGQRR